MLVKVHVSVGDLWEEVEVEMNEVNPRIAMVLALHDAGPAMQKQVGVSPMIVVDRMMSRFSAAIHALRALPKDDDKEDDDGNTTTATEPS